MNKQAPDPILYSIVKHMTSITVSGKYPKRILAKKKSQENKEKKPIPLEEISSQALLPSKDHHSINNVIIGFSCVLYAYPVTRTCTLVHAMGQVWPTINKSILKTRPVGQS